MEPLTHNLSNLFDQLGLASDSTAIERFIQLKRPLSTNALLSEAPFWTSPQALFLREEILKDADWAEVIDQLNIRLHAN